MADFPIPFNDRDISYTAVGTETDFDTDFPIFEEGDVVVIRTRAAVETTLTITADYTVSIDPADGIATITPTGSILAADTWRLKGNITLARTSDYQQRSGWVAAEINLDYDRIWVAIQEIARDLAAAALDPQTTPLGTEYGGTGVSYATSALLLAGLGITGLQSKWIPAADWVPTITNGATKAVRELATNDLMLDYLEFIDGSSKYATYDWVPEKKWDGGTVSFVAYLTAQSGTGSQTVEIELSGVAVSHDDAMDAAPGTAGASTATYTAANDMLIGTTSGAITIAGSPANADLVQLKITRDHATDNLGATAELIGIMLFYTTEAGNDA